MWGGYYECNYCHKWLHYIEVDHIIKRSVRPDLVFDKSNLQLLCHSCHVQKDQVYKKKIKKTIDS